MAVYAVEADGWVYRPVMVGAFEVGAVIVSPGGAEFAYENPVSARADFLALTGVEL
ncbi:hypothetical protein [Microbacterium sp.]|uniref:hypothetical protein n=1 Tax=Microbacterium sp. TaxID=51671 RepID=UPI0039E2F11F